MSKPSAPASPDYQALAEQQSGASQTLAAQQTAANRPDVNTPWGSLAYGQGTPTIDPATGAVVDNPQESVNLNPLLSGSLNNQLGLQNTETGVASDLFNSTSGNLFQPPAQAPGLTSGTGAGQGINYNPESMNPEAENAVWNQFQTLQQPLMQQQSQQTMAQLAAQGLKPGDPAYDTAIANLRQSQGQQTQVAMDQSVGMGQQEAATLFGEGNAAQAQGYGQGLTQTNFNNSLVPQNISNQEAELGLGQQRNAFDLNEVNALMSGNQVSMPSFPGTTSAGVGQAPDLLGAGEQQGNAMLNAYNAQMGSANSQDAAGAGLISSLAMMAMMGSSFSDEELKTDVKRVGETDSGEPIHTYRFKGSPITQMGVMAQHLRKRRPDAVVRDPGTGYLKVDYSKVS